MSTFASSEMIPSRALGIDSTAFLLITKRAAKVSDAGLFQIARPFLFAAAQ